MNWLLQYLPEVENDMKALSKSQQIMVRKAIRKVQQNPLPQNEGGYGKPLGNKNGLNLSGLLKIKLRSEGIRIVYKLIRTETAILIVVIGLRADEEVYEAARKRKDRHGL